jgi:hypothetical protein
LRVNQSVRTAIQLRYNLNLRQHLTRDMRGWVLRARGTKSGPRGSCGQPLRGSFSPSPSPCPCRRQAECSFPRSNTRPTVLQIPATLGSVGGIIQLPNDLTVALCLSLSFSLPLGAPPCLLHSNAGFAPLTVNGWRRMRPIREFAPLSRTWRAHGQGLHWKLSKL